VRCWASASWACQLGLAVCVVAAVPAMVMPRGVISGALGVVACVGLMFSVFCVSAPRRWVRAIGVEPLGRPRM
jgi:hypothetical protein